MKVAERKDGGLWRRMARAGAVVRKPSPRFSLATLLGAGAVLGVLFWGGFNWAMELSNTETFCVSCHEMRETVYKELKQTAHYKNKSGVQALCADCHVPKTWHYKLARKIQATNELYHKIVGTVGTLEKFETKRLDLARSVWAAMKATDSRECRNCHSLEAMDLDKQVRPAQRRHRAAVEKGETCIDCHQGIAHALPKGWQTAAGN
jgi:cytochrome c-type protein NapC